MVASGKLAGRRVGRAWLIDGATIAAAEGISRRRGRPLSPANAWAALDLLAGGNATWLSAVARSQLRAVLRSVRSGDDERWSALLQSRADTQFLAGHPSSVQRVVESPDVVVSGPKAARDHGLGVMTVDAMPEAIIALTDWPRLSKDLHLAPTQDRSQARLVAHFPRWSGALEAMRGNHKLAQLAVAADLLDSPESRVRAAGLVALVVAQRDAGLAGPP